jgi:hypothetical protein
MKGENTVKGGSSETGGKVATENVTTVVKMATYQEIAGKKVYESLQRKRQRQVLYLW